MSQQSRGPPHQPHALTDEQMRRMGLNLQQFQHMQAHNQQLPPQFYDTLQPQPYFGMDSFGFQQSHFPTQAQFVTQQPLQSPMQQSNVNALFAQYGALGQQMPQTPNLLNQLASNSRAQATSSLTGRSQRPQLPPQGMELPPSALLKRETQDDWPIENREQLITPPDEDTEQFLNNVWRDADADTKDQLYHIGLALNSRKQTQSSAQSSAHSANQASPAQAKSAGGKPTGRQRNSRPKANAANADTKSSKRTYDQLVAGDTGSAPTKPQRQSAPQKRTGAQSAKTKGRTKKTQQPEEAVEAEEDYEEIIEDDHEQRYEE
jgi:hypothetical protein